MEEIINAYIVAHEEGDIEDGDILFKCSGSGTSRLAPQTGEDGEFIVREIETSYSGGSWRPSGTARRLKEDLPTFQGKEEDFVIQIITLAKRSNFHLVFSKRWDHDREYLAGGTTLCFFVSC